MSMHHVVDRKKMSKNEAHIALRVQAGAKKSELVDLAEGILRLRVAAPAREGKANAAVVALLSQALGVPKAHVRILRGHTSRDKLVAIEGMNSGDARARLLSRLA